MAISKTIIMGTNAAEHDYATFIISQALQDEDSGQVVYHVEELKQDMEGMENGETVQEEMEQEGDVEEMERYELVAEGDNVSNPLVLQTSDTHPRYRRETSGGSSGYWSEADVHRLLKVYLRHVKEKPLLRGKPTNAMWQSIIKEFDVHENFSRLQVKTKMQRLKIQGKNILKNGEAESTKWPFWKDVYELLNMEMNVLEDDNVENSNGTKTWSEEETENLLKHYRKYLGSFVGSASSVERKSIWIRIAAALHRPRYQVTFKFQTLKAKWRRYKKSLRINPNATCPVVIQEFDKLMAAERIARQQKRKINQTLNQTARKTWSHEETMHAAQLYANQLREIKESGQVTKLCNVFQTVAREMDEPFRDVQVKLLSLRNHHRRYKSVRGKKKKWRYLSIMNEVMKLEKAIWKDFDEDGEVDRGRREKQAEEVPGTSSQVQDADMPEPAWFKKYRAEVEGRHKDRVDVLKKMLTVLEKLGDRTQQQ